MKQSRSKRTDASEQVTVRRRRTIAQRGQLVGFEIASSGQNGHLLQNPEDAHDLGMSRQGGKQFLELRVIATPENNNL